GVALDSDLLHDTGRFLLDDFLDASVGESSRRPVLEYHDWVAGDDSTYRRAASDGPGRPKLGPRTGAAIPRGRSSRGCSRFIGTVGYDRPGFSLSSCHTLVFCCVGNFQPLGPILGAT